jgi:quercetin dioxygenase-like cupin family protein
MNIKELHSQDKAVSALSIFKGAEANNISLQLNAGALLKEHITKVPALLVCILGKAVYGDENGQRIELLPGDYVNITAMVKHWVEALEDSQLILMK